MSQLQEVRRVKRCGEGGAGLEAFGCQLFTAVIGEVGLRPPEATGIRSARD
jgi:hypothetical protein